MKIQREQFEDVVDTKLVRKNINYMLDSFLIKDLKLLLFEYLPQCSYCHLFNVSSSLVYCSTTACKKMVCEKCIDETLICEICHETKCSFHAGILRNCKQCNKEACTDCFSLDCLLCQSIICMNCISQQHCQLCFRLFDRCCQLKKVKDDRWYNSIGEIYKCLDCASPHENKVKT